MAYGNYRPQSRQGGNRKTKITYVKPQFVGKGVTFPGIDWQQYGYLTGALWPSREHIIRIIPGYDPETREIFHQNVNVNSFSEDENYTEYLSDTFYIADTVQGFGEAKSHFITSYEPGSPEDEKYGGDTVMATFIRNVFWTVKPLKSKKPRFGTIPEMFRWTAPRDGTLPKNKRSIIVQALLFKLQGEPMTDWETKEPLLTEDGQLVPKLGVVAIDGPSSVNAVLKALVDPKDPAQPLDAIKNNKYGGFAELDGRKMYLNPAVMPEGNHAKYLNPSVHDPTTKSWTPDPFPLTAEDVYAWWKPWQDLILWMDPAKQAQVIAAEFGADAVNYLVGTDPVYADFEMPADIARAGYGRFSKFTDGVTEVKQSGTVTVPATGGMGPAKNNKAETTLAAAFTPAKRPAGLSRPAATAAPSASRGPIIPKGSGVDKNAFAATLGQIRHATKPAQQEEEEPEGNIADDLAEDNFDDYEDEQQ